MKCYEVFDIGVLVVYNHGNNTGLVIVMKYINGVPENRKPITLYEVKKPKKTKNRGRNDQQLREADMLDPELKAELDRNNKQHELEKEMHHPGEIEHKRELVGTLRGGKGISKSPEHPEKIVVREPAEPVLKALLVDKETGHQNALWITANIIYQDIPHGVYWVYNELSQGIISAIISGDHKLRYKRHDYSCKELKRAQGISLEKFVVDLKKVKRETT